MHVLGHNPSSPSSLRIIYIWVYQGISWWSAVTSRLSVTLMNFEISLIVGGVLAIRTSAWRVCTADNILGPIVWRVIRIYREDEDLLCAVIATCGRALLARRVVKRQCLITQSNPFPKGQFRVITISDWRRILHIVVGVATAKCSTVPWAVVTAQW